MVDEMIIYYECNHDKTVSVRDEIDNFCPRCGNKIRSIIRLLIRKDKIETIHNFVENQDNGEIIDKQDHKY